MNITSTRNNCSCCGFLITLSKGTPLLTLVKHDLYYVEDINTNFNVVVYPNPFVNEFEASFDKVYNNMNVLIQTLSGQTVFRKNYLNNNSIRINLSGYSGQIYIVTINADGKRFTAKLIKND